MCKKVRILFVLLLLATFAFQAMGYGVQYTDEAKTKALHWKSGKIPIAISTSLIKQNSSIRAESDTENAILRSLKHWEQVADIEFDVSWTDLQTVSPSGNFGDGTNLITIAPTDENLLLFGSETEDISARTRVFFNRKGFINEADIVLNPYQQFSTDGAIGTFDLEATVTHEVGHLLGLEHSSLISSTMYAHQAKNGAMNLPGFGMRTLAEDDITGIRALYGSSNLQESCCGRLIGKITRAKGKAGKNLQIWAEEASSGRVMAGVLTETDGSFMIEGLPEETYRIYTQDFDIKGTLGSTEELGEIEIKNGKTANLIKQLKGSPKNAELLYVGFNGQISELAVPLNEGKAYSIYVGGKSLDLGNVAVTFNSPFFSVSPNTVKRQDFGSQVSVFSFEVSVKSQAPPGEYSFKVQKQNGETGFIVGGISIEKFVNPWSNFTSIKEN